MATSLRKKVGAAALAATVGLTGFAPAANAGILDILAGGLSISAGQQSDYDHGSQAVPTGFHANTPMAADVAADNARGRSDILGTEGIGGVSRLDTATVWPNELYRSKSLEIARIINKHRARRGEPTMALDPAMSKAAQAWAEEMARQHFFDHDAGTRMGEIIAMRYNIHNADTAERFVQQWENSEPHRILMHRSDFHVMGVGIAHDPQTHEVYAVVRLYYE